MKIKMRDGTGTMNLKYLVEDIDRHGNVRVYLRRHGRKVRMHETPGTDAFMTEYRKALGNDASSGTVVLTMAKIGNAVDVGQTITYTGTCTPGGMTWQVTGSVAIKFLPKT